MDRTQHIRICILHVALLFLIGMTSCGDEEKFEIQGEVAGNPTMNMYMRYYGNDRVMQGVTAVRDGKFEFFGSSKQPTIVEMTDNENRLLGRVYIVNKQSITVKLDRHNPYKIHASGNKINEEWSRAVNSMADSLITGRSDVINRAVEQYIAKHPKSQASTLVFLTNYDASVDPFRADSVLKSIDPDARIGGVLDGYATVGARYSAEEAQQPIDTLLYRPAVRDTVMVFTPNGVHASLIVLSAIKTAREDSIVPMLRDVASLEGRDSIRILDLVLSMDSSVWRRAIKTDTATWQQGWMPGGLFARGLDRLAIPSLPYFIVVDSLGNQLFRTNSTTAVQSFLTTPK